jgi:hypothetical protein
MANEKPRVLWDLTNPPEVWNPAPKVDLFADYPTGFDPRTVHAVSSLKRLSRLEHEDQAINEKAAAHRGFIHREPASIYSEPMRGRTQSVPRPQPKPKKPKDGRDTTRFPGILQLDPHLNRFYGDPEKK